MSPGPSNLKTDEFGGDNRNRTSHDTDAAPINIKLSNCEKTKVYHRKRYVAWIFDKRMNPLYNSHLNMNSKTKTKILQNSSSQREKLTTKRLRRIWGILICDQNLFSIYFSVTFFLFYDVVMNEKKCAAKRTLHCFTANVKKRKFHGDLNRIDENLYYSLYDTNALTRINGIYSISLLYYEYELIFDVNWAKHLFQIKRTHKYCQQQTHSFQQLLSSDSKCQQQTHSFQQLLSSDSKCQQQTHSLQQISSVDNCLNLHLMHKLLD